MRDDASLLDETHQTTLVPVTFDRYPQSESYSSIAKPRSWHISRFGASKRADRSDRNCASISEPSARFFSRKLQQALGALPVFLGISSVRHTVAVARGYPGILVLPSPIG